MNETTTLADRVREALSAAGFHGGPGFGPDWVRFAVEDGPVAVVGAEAEEGCPDSFRRVMLSRYAQALLDVPMAVRELDGRLYVGDASQEPEARVAEARDVADMCRSGYARHAESATALGFSPAEAPGPVLETDDGGAFTIKRGGRAYRVTVAPEAEEGRS